MGKGGIEHIDDDGDYSISVAFGHEVNSYTKDGKFYTTGNKGEV